MPDMVARLKLEIDKNSLRGISGQIMDDTKKATGGGAGGIMGMLGTLPKMLTVLAGIAGGIAILTQASGLLRGVLSGIGKMILFALRPLGDILGVALMPILYILKPIGLFFNMLMRPYIQKAMAAMRAGGVLMKEGRVTEAMGAFGVGLEFLLKPFLDLTVKANTEIVAGFADLLSAIPIVGGAFAGMGDTIRNAGQMFIDITTNALDTQLGGLLAQTEAITGKSMSNIILNLQDSEVLMGNIAWNMKNGITTPLTEAYNWIITRWGPDFVTSGKNIFEELKRIASTPTLAPTQMFGQTIMMPSGWRPTGTETQAGGGMTVAPNVNVDFGTTIIQAGGVGGADAIRKVVEDHYFGSYNELKSKLGG